MLNFGGPAIGRADGPPAIPRERQCKQTFLPGALPAPAPPLPPAELAMTLLSVPPMVGMEYVDTDLLRRLWEETCALMIAEMKQDPGGPEAWLRRQSPSWHLVGRVTFHLAENKRDPERPFAFLATFTHRLSNEARPQYVPLGAALREYAGAGNRKPADSGKFLRIAELCEEIAARQEKVLVFTQFREITGPLAAFLETGTEPDGGGRSP